MKLKIFDTKATIISKKRAFKDWNSHNFLFNNISDSVLEKITEIKDSYKNILLITSDKDELLSKIFNLKFDSIIIVSYFENKRLKESKNYDFSELPKIFNSKKFEESFDLVISNLCLHRVNDIMNFTNSIKKLLTKNGLYFCSYFGGRSLNELRESLIQTDDQIRNKIFQRVIPFIDMVDAVNIHNKIGFIEIVSDKTKYNLKYTNVKKILEDIKGMGENSCLTEKFKGLITKNFIDQLEINYKKKFLTSDNKLKLTCETIYLVMWKI